MKNHRILLIFIVLVAFLFTASITYGILFNPDPYNHHSGLGATVAVSPEDEALVFSYYENGREAIYAASLKDGKVRKVTKPADEDHRMPQFSPDGKGILYLAADDDGVQSLHYINDLTGDKSIQLTGTDTHVSSAAFSPDGRSVYYIAIPAEDFLKPEGEKENGADLFSVNAKGGNVLKLTDKDSFAMDELSVSVDGTMLFYTEFDGVQRLMAYSIKKGTSSVYLDEYIRDDLYYPSFSYDNGLLAYTAVTEESKNKGSTFEYELFLMETSTGETKRLTDFNASVTSPVFFHLENQIVFLTQPNWPSEPAVYETMTVDYNSGEIASLRLDFPETTHKFQPATIVHWLTTPITVTGLYLLLVGLLTVYCQSALQKGYLPAKISAILTGIVFAGSFLAGAFNPWAAISLIILAAGLAVCTIIIFIFAYIYREVGKSAREL